MVSYLHAVSTAGPARTIFGKKILALALKSTAGPGNAKAYMYAVRRKRDSATAMNAAYSLAVDTENLQRAGRYTVRIS